MMSKKQYMHSRGVTLVEIIVATVIIAITTMGLANLFVVGKRYIMHSRSRMAGGELGRFFLEPLDMQVRQDQWEPNSNCLTSDGSLCPGPETIGSITYAPDYNITPVGGGTSLRRVELILAWTEPSQ